MIDISTKFTAVEEPHPFGFEGDGSIVQVSWARSSDEAVHEIKPPIKVADSLGAFLMFALSPERSAVGSWSPGTLLPVSGQEKSTKKKAVPASTSNGSECLAAIKKVIDRKVVGNRLDFFSSQNPPAIETIKEVEARLNVRLPADYAAFIATYGAVRVEANQTDWPRPTDTAESWMFEFGVTFLGIARDLPDADLEAATRKLRELEPHDASELVPFCAIQSTGAYYCLNTDGEIVLLAKERTLPERIDLQFATFFEGQIDELLERLEEMKEMQASA